MKVVFVLGLFVQFLGSYGFIVPDEVPSILSVVWSNIPTIKKGTDSRLGWGFRLGNRADFQVMVELGPQQYTQPLANQEEKSNKRDAVETLADVLYAQRQHEKKEKKIKKVISNTDGGKWLDQWSKQVTQQNGEQHELEPKPGLAIGEIDAKSVIPEDSQLEQMEKLFAKRPLATKVATQRPTTQKPTTTTASKDALDNVDLDE